MKHVLEWFALVCWALGGVMWIAVAVQAWMSRRRATARHLAYMADMHSRYEAWRKRAGGAMEEITERPS